MGCTFIFVSVFFTSADEMCLQSLKSSSNFLFKFPSEGGNLYYKPERPKHESIGIKLKILSVTGDIVVQFSHSFKGIWKRFT